MNSLFYFILLIFMYFNFEDTTLIEEVDQADKKDIKEYLELYINSRRFKDDLNLRNLPFFNNSYYLLLLEKFMEKLSYVTKKTSDEDYSTIYQREFLDYVQKTYYFDSTIIHGISVILLGAFVSYYAFYVLPIHIIEKLFESQALLFLELSYTKLTNLSLDNLTTVQKIDFLRGQIPYGFTPKGILLILKKFLEENFG